VSWSAHRHSQRLRSDPDLERLLDGDAVCAFHSGGGSGLVPHDALAANRVHSGENMLGNGVKPA
jgi:hypothetical protein